MPLQGLLVAEAVSRIQKYEVEPLLGTPVGQIVGQMNSERSVQAVFDELTRGFERAVDRIDRIAGRTAGCTDQRTDEPTDGRADEPTDGRAAGL